MPPLTPAILSGYSDWMKDRNLLLAYVIAGILTLAFQIWWRSFECGDACAFSYTKAVIWSVVWPLSWVALLMGYL